MTQYILRRLAGMVVTLLLLVLIVVLFGRIVPTDVIDVILADSAQDDQTRERLEEQLGLNRSVVEEYFSYLWGAMRGDLGESLLSGQSVRSMMSDRLIVTAELAVFGLLLGGLVGTSIGVISAIKQDGPVDYALRSIAVFGLTVPNFALATAAIVIPSIYWQWSPPLFFTRFTEDPVKHLSQFILPAVVLAVGLMGAQMRVMRTQMLEVMRQDYIRTARVKGLAGTHIIFRHALRNALIPVVSLFGLQVAIILSGSVILETIFGLPGMGTLLLQSVNQKDWPVVQGVTLVIGVWVVAVNLLVDLSYGFIDPRVKVT